MSDAAKISTQILRDGATKRAAIELHEALVAVCVVGALKPTAQHFHRRKAAEWLDVLASQMGFDLTPRRINTGFNEAARAAFVADQEADEEFMKGQSDG